MAVFRMTFVAGSIFMDVRVYNGHAIYHVGVRKETDIDAITDKQQQQRISQYAVYDLFKSVFLLSLNKLSGRKNIVFYLIGKMNDAF